MTQNQKWNASSSIGGPRDEAARTARLKRRLAAVTTAVAAGAVIVGATAIASAHEEPHTTRAAARSIHSGKVNIPGEQVYDIPQRHHVLEPVDYSSGPTPPVGGPHHPTWQNANGDVYDQPLRNEHAVHSLEHGVVWVTYARYVPQRVVDALTKKVAGMPYRMMSPVPGQDAPVKLTAWGRQLSVTSADDPRVDRFFAAYVQGPQSPEPEGPVTGGRTTP
ncbi:DUF3105 domain-containing protein [Streptomyces sp. NPDC001903]|uniref:DUF3105 domain-containing protein n=1 Tax=Streptomyces sp. NPDC001903 TaxID=3364622 RepID=UPI0036A9D8F7